MTGSLRRLDGGELLRLRFLWRRRRFFYILWLDFRWRWRLRQRNVFRRRRRFLGGLQCCLNNSRRYVRRNFNRGLVFLSKRNRGEMNRQRGAKSTPEIQWRRWPIKQRFW